MILKSGEKEIQAYVPNTGRMREFLIPGQPFYLIPSQDTKLKYRVVSSRYQDAYVLLDTVKVNDLVAELIRQNALADIAPPNSVIEREYSIMDSRFDFHLITPKGEQILIEVKSCTLCHNGVAMFPDAPTRRGQKQLKTLHTLGSKDYKCTILYLILNAGARSFFPNFHTDPDYARLGLQASNVSFAARKIALLNPFTVDADSLEKIPIDFECVKSHCTDRGGYLLILYSPRDLSRAIGGLGSRHFPKGWYVYVGSALNSLAARLGRHRRQHKSSHWHIDYLIRDPIKIVQSLPIRRRDRIEGAMATQLHRIADDCIAGFGASDSKVSSHLLYFSGNPLQRRAFVNILFDFMTFTEHSPD